MSDRESITHHSDSDEAPEVVTKQSAKEQALNQQRQEKEAHAQVKEAKRKRKVKKVTAEAEEVPKLSDDVLSAVATRHEEEDAVDSVAEIRAQKQLAVKRAKVAKLMEKKTHTRQFGNIQVQTLETLENMQTRELSASAKEFLLRRTAPSRARMNILDGHPSQFTKKKQRI
ncbi:uncharacterized protein PHALS_00071 [Plasmopara halstedii]|uniref:Uncharacterized protein n=1 Tax=Plasmopara halstedii TaxID=4781 RepID=A0A0P1A6H1_PLAHL|nr:uncharacterized protein PHALS_00071 [Plasmopara halstedii]CEG35736.1 hypothetical protein PHALS_00071 [Plasmopara halstedii]|eukprot:XP_024572105.1 hypothetical protein PHALS_00071 [Plasmopara halstedii]